MNILNHKKTILIIIILLVTFFVYWFVFVSKKDASNTVNKSPNQNLQTQVNVSNTPYDKEFVTSLLGLNSVSLDVSIFESNAYKALDYPKTPFTINYSTESGRDNPFLPIGVNSNNVNSNTLIQNKTNIPTTSVSTSSATTTLKTPTGKIPTTVSTSTLNPVPKQF